MKFPANPFTAALRAGQKQVGIWVSLASPYAAEVVAGAGYDWLVVDTEHAPGDMMTTMGQLQAIAAQGGTALVRPAWNDPVVVKRLLDLGAQGLVFPMIQTVEEARAAVAATRYPPRGIRGVAGSGRGNAFGRVTDYYTRVEAELTVILQIETRAALARAVEIGTVDGCTGVFFGPADIAADMGMIGQPLAPAVWEAIMPAARALMDKGVPVGTLVTDPARAAELLNAGFTFVACATDVGLLSRATDTALATVRAALKTGDRP
jgi:4-hydroxy-2-oxoheptanedioate aldolase